MSAASITLRLLRDGPADGATNMAVDEVLLESCVRTGMATVRVYRWQRPTLSLGYFQPLSSRAQHTASQTCPVVRRRSGGGAILHHWEWTYALAIPPAAPWCRHTEDLYRLVHQSWVDALARVAGVTADWCRPTAADSGSAFLCFQRRSRWDLAVAGVKVLGSAQRRAHRGILQHGSLLLRCSSSAPECPGVQDLVPKTVDQAALVDDWLKILSQRLVLPLEPAPLSDMELSRVDYWRDQRFGTDGWTRRR